MSMLPQLCAASLVNFTNLLNCINTESQTSPDMTYLKPYATLLNTLRSPTSVSPQDFYKQQFPSGFESFQSSFLQAITTLIVSIFPSSLPPSVSTSLTNLSSSLRNIEQYFEAYEAPKKQKEKEKEMEEEEEEEVTPPLPIPILVNFEAENFMTEEVSERNGYKQPNFPKTNVLNFIRSGSNCSRGKRSLIRCLKFPSPPAIRRRRGFNPPKSSQSPRHRTFKTSWTFIFPRREKDPT